MAITQNGNSFTWTGTVTVTNATDLTTGVATLVLTPSGGVGQLPVLAQGTPGLPPVLDSVSVTTLPAGSSASGSWVTNSSGGAGQSSHYTLNLNIPQGPAGQSLNSIQILTINGSPTGGSFTMSWGSTTTAPITISGLSSTTIASALTSAFSSYATFAVSGTNPYYITVSPVNSTPIVMMTASNAGLTGGSGGTTQTVTISGSPSGNFTLTYLGQTTGSIAYNATAATVQTALAALSTVGSGNVSVTGSAGGPWTVVFGSLLAPAQPLTASTITGGTIAITANNPTLAVQGSYTLAGGSDIDTTTTALQDQYMVKWNASTSKFRWAAQMVGATMQGTVTGYTGNNSLQSLGFITIPAQPFNWVPDVDGQATPGGTVNTQVDLCAIICSTANGNNINTGQQVAYGQGITGITTAQLAAHTAPQVQMAQAFLGNLSSGYGVVPAGVSSTLYFAAKQVNATTDSYQVSATGAYFSVKIHPVPGTN